MPWSIASYSATPGGNTSINGINIAEGCNASGINDAIRQLMADVAAYFGTAGAFAGSLSVASTLSVTGAATVGSIGASASPLPVLLAASEKARFTAAGLLVGTTTNNSAMDNLGGQIYAPRGFFVGGSSGLAWDAGTFMSGTASSNVTFQVNSGGVTLALNATSWAAVSDERLKTPFIPFTGAMSKVSAIKVGTGRYLSDDPTMSRSFLSAQSLKAVLPEAVGEAEDGTLNARYAEVVPLLIAALAEAETRIAALEARG